ncbi:MAG: metalloregulator ArsR/SmtB family transcription factor [Candidatus Peribacteraceae bacterium]|jgi:DNA-binding transcriptional ArsR family regulator|nr:metalloregulator ArsR/SmtB family transcription factor [Candidatus Peribacteraceae bacterium]HCI04270.1 hypothetical protein [Candidatus Peribacteria bacterium]|tara:strand:- start:615 stop:887 length:273 start_codon:yes stop_codon:yes gene_type:complete
MNNLQLHEQYLKVLASKKRLHILLYLRRNKLATVNELADAIDLKKQATSKHLRILRLAKIVKPNKKGLFVKYRLALPQEKMVRQVLSVIQ